jgi:hypothetical protein
MSRRAGEYWAGVVWLEGNEQMGLKSRLGRNEEVFDAELYA